MITVHLIVYFKPDFWCKKKERIYLEAVPEIYIHKLYYTCTCTQMNDLFGDVTIINDSHRITYTINFEQFHPPKHPHWKKTGQ